VPEAARARHDAALLAARAGDHAEARRLAKQAFAAYDGLDAGSWHRQLRADLQVAGLSMRPRRGTERPATGWDSLTASEQTIVQQLGGGLTNTEIAARLFVSRRTVESHLGRVYAKLGLTTRSQLVAAVARRLG
jgi:DNA-binding CsgD family transcriptional regulator